MGTGNSKKAEEREGNYDRTPERKLMVAVLFDALKCIERAARCVDEYSARSLLERESLWFLRKGDDYIYSFETICETLEVDRNAALEKVIPLIKNAHARIRKAGELAKLKERMGRYFV